ncbi:UDP-glucose 6-dehydrogenase [Micromonospora saelicesensis]|uniref:UDP-glucose 6-dehydrogenase n=1 Tax=Micromonospora saelicesensis TaxID=285676 RepID=A0A328NRE8_9ACTN|nr:nucleotide sugar dehydrogenase [Micromonospora saelicesensis]RAO29976.1 UDP-glucose 6-dehydrogenase [Micromonospora saelicesensis]
MASIEVVGQGFVGLTTTLLAADAGHDVVGIEVDPARAAALRAGQIPFAEPGVQEVLQQLQSAGRIRVVGAGHSGHEPATLVIAVPTATLPDGSVDDRAVISALDQFADPGRHELVIVRSTLPPGHSTTLLDRFPDLAETYVYWPEFLNQGRALAETRHPDRVVVGAASPQATSLLKVLLKSFGFDHDLVCWHSVAEAEAVKQFSNAALAVNQVLGAEIARLCEHSGLDARAVLASVSRDARLSRLLLNPSPPLVDSCLRKDLTALVAAGPRGESAMVLAASLAQATAQRHEATRRVVRHVDALPSTASVLIVGAGFAAGVSDTKGSLLWDLLPALPNSHVAVWDPYAEQGAFDAMSPAVAVADLAAAAVAADVIVVLVPHPEVYAVRWSSVLAGLARRGGVLLDYCAALARQRVDDPLLRRLIHGLGFSSGCHLCAA